MKLKNMSIKQLVLLHDGYDTEQKIKYICDNGQRLLDCGKAWKKAFDMLATTIDEDKWYASFECEINDFLEEMEFFLYDHVWYEPDEVYRYEKISWKEFKFHMEKFISDKLKSKREQKVFLDQAAQTIESKIVELEKLRDELHDKYADLRRKYFRLGGTYEEFNLSVPSFIVKIY